MHFDHSSLLVSMEYFFFSELSYGPDNNIKFSLTCTFFKFMQVSFRGEFLSSFQFLQLIQIQLKTYFTGRLTDDLLMADPALFKTNCN